MRNVSQLLRDFVLSSLIISSSCDACTNFFLKSEDNAAIVGRSLEFGQVLPTRIQSFPRNQAFQSTLPNNKKVMSWKNQYGFIGMVFIPANAVLDGFNEKGLSIGALWMPDTVYPTPPVQFYPENTLYFADLMSWILGNFATVDEVKRALPKINLYITNVAGFQEIPPLHLIVQDTAGNAIVLEFLKGSPNIFDNPIGILTNSPEFPWHMTNLRNYINLSDINSKAVKISGTVLEPTGQGSGMAGIPGDWTPPSRFVRAALFTQALAKPHDARDAVVAAIHILNTVDIPYGVIRASVGKDFDYTQWIVVKDLTNKKLFYRTYSDPNVHQIDLEESLNTPISIELSTNSP